MKRFLVHADGRLKIGRVAFLVFLSVMVGCSLVYYVSRPADKVLMAVKHVFEAEEAPAPEPEKTEPAPAEEPAAPEKKAEEPAQPPPAAPAPAEDTKKESSPPPAVAEAKPPVPENQSAPPPVSHAAPGPESQEPPAVQMAAVPQKPVPDKPPETASPSEPKPERIVVEIPKPSDPAPLTVGKKAAESVRFEPIPLRSPEKSSKSETQEAAAGEMVLASTDYLAVHKSWRETGEKAAGEGNIPLRIESLRAVYPLFQMKAVVLRGDKPWVDLADGTRISEGALEPYSTTCFSVADPFAKWGEALKKAGFQPGGPVDVRYYMYDSVRNAIYARAFQAFDCCRKNGMIPADVSADSVDLLGRAYAIKRQGGGGFGVFVPVRIDLPDGRSVPVDPSCFKGSADIDHLMASGLLK